MLVTIFRTVILYVFVIFAIRLMGKRQIGELQPSELVVTILISELASIPIQDLNRPITNGVIGILILVVLEIYFSEISLKSIGFRRMFSGQPAIVIRNGKVDQAVMRKLRLNINDLLEGIRLQGNFYIEEIDYAIMETSGKINIIPKEQYQSVSRNDLKKEITVRQDSKGLPIVLISDGVLQKKSFKNVPNISEAQVLKELKKQNLEVKDVFIFIADNHANFTTIKKENK